MTKQSAPLVTRDLIESDQWQEWLDAHDKFKFENGCHLRDTKFTAYKSKTGHWTAQRRMHGRLRHQYLGKPQDMTYEKLQAVAEKLGIVSGTAYETGLKTTLRKADKELLAELRSDTSALAKSHKTESGDYETKRAITLQAGEEISQLRAENAALQERISYLLDERGLIQAKATEDARIRIEQLEKQNTQLDNANWEMQKQYTAVDEIAKKRLIQLQEFQSQLNSLRQTLKSAKQFKLHGRQVIRVEDFEKFLSDLPIR